LGLLAGVNRTIDYQPGPLNAKPVPAEKFLDGTETAQVSAPMLSRALLATALLAAAPALADEAPASCPFAAGARPVDTLPAGAPHGADIPIDTVVVFMQENRSYDHYLGQLRKRGAERAPRDASNPDPTDPQAPPIARFHQTRYCEVADLDHSWNGSHAEFDDGSMDGFTAANVDDSDPNGSRAMGYYTAKDLPFYYKLYRKFATSDRQFCSLLGPTWPNRFYLLAATSFGHIGNDPPPNGMEYSQRTIFNALDEAGVTWKVYHSGLPFALLFAYVRSQPSKLVSVDQYFADAAAGTLPQVAFVDPMFLGAENVENDEHPPSNIQVGQEFASRVVRALFDSPQWPRAALFIVYDEHGGFYDHVPPPPACVPDAIPPALGQNDTVAAFDRFGFRVPMVAVSPYSRRRFVSHVNRDHASILRFIETRFDLPALTARDANADPMLELFDFTRPRFARPPRLPAATIDEPQRSQCEAIAAQ